MTSEPWQRVKRAKVYDSKFLKVYEDTVRLPSGTVIDDYTVVEKPSVVIVVATTPINEVVILREYKYAANQYMLTLPAGHKKESESAVEAAKRELLEETGYGGSHFEEIGTLFDYPTKDLHTLFVVRAKNIEKVAKEDHEETESIEFQIITIEELRDQIKHGEWKSSSALAALTISGIL